MAGAMNQGSHGGGPGGMNHVNGSSSQPQATEYTLQGVMRFLQTEWHRHERDRNAWEIEKQEMKGRIANLEGAARRADATQKALKKYVAILEAKVKEQSAQLKAAAGGEKVEEPPKAKKLDREALIQAKLHSSSDKDLGVDLERIDDDESQRSELKNFLDQCQAEFTYLMITPANPIPPRESPPLPMIEDLREGDGYGMNSGQQPMDPLYRRAQDNLRDVLGRQQPPASNHAQPMQQQQQPAGQMPMKNPDIQQPQPAAVAQPMLRTADSQQGFGSLEWPGSMSVSSRMVDEVLPEQNHGTKPNVQAERIGFDGPKQDTVDSEAWDFNESSFPDPASHPPPPASNRPDTDVFPTADNLPKSPGRGPLAHRRKSSLSRRRSTEQEMSLNALAQKTESGNFKLRFGLRGHLNTVRSVIFSGGGSPGEPEICTAGDDGLIKRFHIPRGAPPIYNNASTAVSDLDVQADFTHRGHNGAVLCLASWSPSPNFSTGGRAQGDGWIFSGGQDSSIRVWERGRVDPKATLDGHTDAVWTLCVLPATLGAVFGQQNPYGTPDRILLASGAADGTVRVWALSQPPQMTSPQPPAASAGRRSTGGRVRGNSMSSGSAFPSSPQPTMATNSPFNHTLVHTISRPNSTASPTCITALSASAETFVVSYSDAAIIVYDTRTGEEIGSMASLETYDGTLGTSVNSVVATTVGLEQSQHQTGHGGLGLNEEDSGASGAGPTGGGRQMAGSGVEGVIISGHEDRFVRFFDANSGQCTYNMLAHPAAISSLSLSPDGRELISAGHDASLRFWSLEKRSCTQEITSHRIMRGEGVCAVVWSQDGRWVVSGGGDGIVKVFAR
ncbi:hypothetical protein VMCG_06911 [Cytospora schulzeri]|uniref:Striatin N-terminal domain-containing protein n=1 Tax=Cytospora schulzeri TaxID=448051 RepID=A0A423W238_9PEZI|nr:hypothetical protein VMCG_06911 [Valsa malicola]